MLTLTMGQIEALGREGRDVFMERLLKHLQALLTLLGKKRENLKEEALAVVGYVRLRGLRTEWQIASIAECVIVFGVDLKTGDAKLIVEDDKIYPDEKVLLIQDLNG